ncbi:mechanosensitive ion channel family protein [Pendulispora brunnea]|uniref:Mechanosensitive ion channel family protein n=1 Tax=Pendulispora brunnea TaxID=2905690 RepID=A0ABZ2KSG8_9BACT
MRVPALDLILHNLVAFGIALVLLMVVGQLLLSGVLHLAGYLLHTPLFGAHNAEPFRKRMKRATLIAVAVGGLLLFIGAMVLTFLHRRALDLVKVWFGNLRQEDMEAVGLHVAYAVGIVVAASLAASLARNGVDALTRLAERSALLSSSRELSVEVLSRLRTVLRLAILWGAASWVTFALGLPPSIRRVVVLATDVLVAFYGCRFLVVLAHLAVDLLFVMSGKLTKLESPLKYLGSLTHLKGITKRCIDYFVYVAAATWVADQFTPDTWFSRAGRVGIRIVAIFYASRVLIEVCLLFINEIFLNKTAGRTSGEIQQRRTLVPVAVGLLRYGIYFSALVMVLREADIDPTPLLAGAGVLGVAVGFGAQAFVGDIVAGFFILFENVLLVGDNVEVSGVRGMVEEIGVRITKIRDESGVLHAIPNGEVRKVANHSKVYVNAVVEVHVPYDEDLTRVRELLQSVSAEVLEAELNHRGVVEVKVHELGQQTVTLRVLARVPPGKDLDMATKLRLRLVDELRAHDMVPKNIPGAALESVKLQIARPAEPVQPVVNEGTTAAAPLPIFKP